jgi:hypothetical protein
VEIFSASSSENCCACIPLAKSVQRKRAYGKLIEYSKARFDYRPPSI